MYRRLVLDLILEAIILRKIFFLILDWKLDSSSWGWRSFLGQHFCQKLVSINNKPEKLDLWNHIINFTPYTNTPNLLKVFSLFNVYWKGFNFSRYLSRITLKDSELNHYESVFLFNLKTYFWYGSSGAPIWFCLQKSRSSSSLDKISVIIWIGVRSFVSSDWSEQRNQPEETVTFSA